MIIAGHLLMIVAFVLGAFTIGACVPIIRRVPRNRWVAVAVGLLAASTMAEHVEKWQYEPPLVATLLDIAGFVVFLAFVVAEHRRA